MCTPDCILRLIPNALKTTHEKTTHDYTRVDVSVQIRVLRTHTTPRDERRHRSGWIIGGLQELSQWRCHAECFKRSGE